MAYTDPTQTAWLGGANNGVEGPVYSPNGAGMTWDQYYAMNAANAAGSGSAVIPGQYSQPGVVPAPDPTMAAGGSSQGYPMGLNPAQSSALGMALGAGWNPYIGTAFQQLAGIGTSGGYPEVSGGAPSFPTAGVSGSVPTVGGVGSGPGINFNANYSQVNPVTGPNNIGSVSAPGDVNAVDTQQMQMALDQARALSSGDVGSSPATEAGMKAWEQLVRPQVLSGLALTGNLGGGATEEALGLSATSAALPLIQQEIANRAALVPQLGNLGLGYGAQQLAAAQGNQQAGLATNAQNLQGQMANQQAGLTTNQQNLQAQMANQGAGLTAGGLNLQGQIANANNALGWGGLNLQGQLANQNAAVQQMALGLQAQGMNQNAAIAAAQQALQGQMANQAAALQRMGLGTQAATALGNLGLGFGGQQLAGANLAANIGNMGFNQQMTGAQQLANLANSQNSLVNTNIGNALNVAGMPYNVQSQQDQAAYNDFLRLQQLAQILNLGPTASIPATPGGSKSTTSQAGGGLFGS